MKKHRGSITLGILGAVFAILIAILVIGVVFATLGLTLGIIGVIIGAIVRIIVSVFKFIPLIIMAVITYTLIKGGIKSFRNKKLLPGVIMIAIGILIIANPLSRIIIGAFSGLIGIIALIAVIAIISLFINSKKNTKFNDWNDEDENPNNYHEKFRKKNNKFWKKENVVIFEKDTDDDEDLFSYKPVKDYDEIIDVEYEDWEPENSQKKTSSKDKIDYSYSKDEETQCYSDYNNKENPTQKAKDNPKNFGINIGYTTEKIEPTDLDEGENYRDFNLTCGNLEILIDKSIETHIKANASVGNIDIGNSSYSAINKTVEKKWIPENGCGKVLYLRCKVYLGTLEIRHI